MAFIFVEFLETASRLFLTKKANCLFVHGFRFPYDGLLGSLYRFDDIDNHSSHGSNKATKYDSMTRIRLSTRAIWVQGLTLS